MAIRRLGGRFHPMSACASEIGQLRPLLRRTLISSLAVSALRSINRHSGAPASMTALGRFRSFGRGRQSVSESRLLANRRPFGGSVRRSALPPMADIKKTDVRSGDNFVCLAPVSGRFGQVVRIAANDGVDGARCGI
jgi:hypothetical protein